MLGSSSISAEAAILKRVSVASFALIKPGRVLVSTIDPLTQKQPLERLSPASRLHAEDGLGALEPVSTNTGLIIMASGVFVTTSEIS